MSTNTWFPGRTKQLSASDDGFKSGTAGAGTTGEPGKSTPVTGLGRRGCSAVGLDNITEQVTWETLLLVTRVDCGEDIAVTTVKGSSCEDIGCGGLPGTA